MTSETRLTTTDIPSSKVCTTCGETKPVEEFYLRRNRPGGVRSDCKVCARAASGAWGKANPNPVNRRHAHLKRTYGMTLEQYTSILAAQDGRCKICRTDTPGGHARVFVVDHCHRTGKNRALLCMRCNLDLGVHEAKHHLFTAYLNDYTQ